MGRGFRFVCVMPLIAACGGTELGATRHVDGEPRIGDAAPPPTAPGSDGGITTSSGESGAPIADAGVRTLACRTLPPDALGTSSFSNPDVTGIRFSPDGTTAYGIASWGDQRSLWRAAIGSDGLVSTTDLVMDASPHADGFVYMPSNVTVRFIPGVGDMLGLAGLPPPSYSQFSHLWFVRAAAPQSEWWWAGSFPPGDPTTVIEDFALDSNGQSYVYLTGSPDGYGNLGVTMENASNEKSAGPFPGGAPPPFYSLALQQLSDLLAVSYRTEIRDPYGDPSPTNPRISDHLDQIDFVHGTTRWTLPLAMRRLVQLRVDSTEDTFVVGVLEDGDALDVRKISGAGVTEWAVAPPSAAGSVDSIVADVTPDGGIVVGWNLGSNSAAPDRVVLQSFSRDGTSCTTRRVPGTATDVAVLADGSILVAMDDAISRFAP